MVITTSSRPQIRSNQQFICLMLFFVLSGLSGCSQPVLPNVVNDIKARGELRVAIQYEPARYEIGPQGKTGFDYHLVAGFADYLDVELVVMPYFAIESMQQALAKSNVDVLVYGSHFQQQADEDRILGPRFHDAAWQLNEDQDDSLLASTYDYFSLVRQQGFIDTLQARYLETDSSVKPVNIEKFIDIARPRLAERQSRFANESKKIPWTLQTALTYQLDSWKDDEDLAAARRFIALTAEVPARVPEASKIAMSLAAFHSGLTHLLDARSLTRRQGGDENDWLDVRQRYPALEDKAVYRHMRYGYVNGTNTVKFVSNVLEYQRVLEALVVQSP